MNKQELAARIWESANKMRSKIEANEYKDYILGFIFYKYLSDKELDFLKSQGATDDEIRTLLKEDGDLTEHIRTNIGYFISYNDLFSTWLEMGKDFDVSNVRDALSAFSRLINDNHKKVFDGIFNTLETGLSKLGDSAASQTKAISDLLYLIKDIPMSGKQSYDVLGFIYEYLISNFAANAGKKAGEFYTPHEVSLLMSEIIANHLRNKEEIQIYDPTSGSGSLLINIGRSIAKYNNNQDAIKYYAQELKQNTYNLTRMNLVMRNISPDNIVTRNGDTLEEDWPYFEENDPAGTYNPLYVDAVVSNPPYSQNWDPANKDNDPRYTRYGIAPKTKADYAFLLHDLYHLKPDGIMTIVLPHGVLFRGGEELTIRKNLIDQNNIVAIIGLPPNIFFGTGIPTIIMILQQKRNDNDVLIVDASKGYIKEGKNNKLRACDIKKIVDAVVGRVSIPKFSKLVSKQEIQDNEYNLNIPRYVDSSEKSESWDIYASMFGGIPKSEILELQKYWDAYPSLMSTLFKNINEEYYKMAVDNIKDAIKNNADVNKFITEYNLSFSGFDKYIEQELINNMSNINVAMEEEIINSEIQKRLKYPDLINRYEAYQLLDDVWTTKIAVDLEILNTEGFEVSKQVDPLMETKKKNNKEVEVQVGWKGHIIPFELVQQTLLKDDTKKLKEKEEQLSEIIGQYAEYLDSISEDDKNSDAINEDGTAFVAAEVKKMAKNIDKKTASEFELIILKVNDLLAKEKDLKAEIKKDSDLLHEKTKTTIENLSDEQVHDLLKLKWIKPITDGISSLPIGVISELSNKIQKLSEKYSTTLTDLDTEISETEKMLSSFIDELTGNEYDMKGLAEWQLLLGGQK